MSVGSSSDSSVNRKRGGGGASKVWLRLLVEVRFGDASSGSTEDAGEDVEVVNAERRQPRDLEADRRGGCSSCLVPADDQDHGKNADGATWESSGSGRRWLGGGERRRWESDIEDREEVEVAASGLDGPLESAESPR